MKRSLLILMSILVIYSSCIIVHHKNFINCYDGSMTNLNNRIKLNGYYVNEHYNSINTIILYNDGYFASLPVNYQNRENLNKHLSQNDKRNIKGSINSGQYKLNGDTIKAQFFPAEEMFRLDMMELWFVVNNDSTISLIKSICEHCPRKGIWKNDGIVFLNPPETYHFATFIEKPDSLSWLRKKKWYWCN